MNCMSTLGMTQFVRESTRLSLSTAENILDLILSSDISSVQISDTLPPISSSDHLLLSFNVFIPHSTSLTPDATDTSTIHLPTYNWSQANFAGINSLLTAVDWHDIFGFNFDAESIWAQFKSVIYPIIDLYVPNISYHTIKNTNHVITQNIFAPYSLVRLPSGEPLELTNPTKLKQNTLKLPLTARKP